MEQKSPKKSLCRDYDLNLGLSGLRVEHANHKCKHRQGDEQKETSKQTPVYDYTAQSGPPMEVERDRHRAYTRRRSGDPLIHTPTERYDPSLGGAHLGGTAHN